MRDQKNPQRIPRPYLRHVFPLRGKRRLHWCSVEWVLARRANQHAVQPYQVSKPDLLAHTATNPPTRAISPRLIYILAITLTLCRYSYATNVNPNCGLLLSTRAGPPLNSALNPSSFPISLHLENTCQTNTTEKNPSQILTNASVSPL